MKANLIGLDLGSDSVRIAVVKREGQNLILEVAASAQSPGGIARIESSEDIAKTADVIKQLVTSSNIKSRDVALCLPENQVYTKVIEMPQLSPNELTAALRYEIDQYIPLPADKVKTDWEILGKNDDVGTKTMNVMLVAAPISLLEKYQTITAGAGVVSQAIETEIISVYRSLLPLLNTQYSSMVIHIGATGTTVTIVKSAVIKMIFSVNLGGLALTRAVSLDLGIDMGQAENYKNAYGFNKDAFEGKIGRAISPVFDQILGDVRRGLLSFREKHNNESIKQVILSGGTARLPGIDTYLTNSLSTQVVIGNAFVAHGIQNVPPELAAEAPAYNVVIGLALRNLL